jgi:hypothetical protein
VPLLPPRKTLPAGTTIRLPEGGQLKHRCGFEVGKQSSPQEPDAASARSNTPTFAGGTLCGSRWTPASHIAISAPTCVPGRPPRRDPDSIPVGGGPLLFFRATPLNSPGSFCAARAVNSAPAPGGAVCRRGRGEPAQGAGEQTQRRADNARRSSAAACNQFRGLPFRQRPYSVEHTRSHLNSEVKQPKARSVLGWGTAWEVLRVPLAFFAQLRT